MKTLSLSRISAAELTVVLPVHNEAAHLPALLRRLKQKADHLIVVDDGSLDLSARRGREGGARVIRHALRQGKTSAIRSALPEALRSEWILFMDGDGQHDPADLDNLWAAREGVDAVLGVRNLHSGCMPGRRKITNLFMSALLRRIAGGGLTDTQCGYRLVRSSCLQGWLPLGKHYEWESELYARLMRCGARTRSVPVKTIYRQESSKIFWPRDAWRFALTCCRLWAVKRA